MNNDLSCYSGYFYYCFGLVFLLWSQFYRSEPNYGQSFDIFFNATQFVWIVFYFSLTGSQVSPADLEFTVYLRINVLADFAENLGFVPRSSQ